MIDLNTLLTAALQQALEGLLKPYEDRIAELEKKLELSENSMRKTAEEVCEWALAGHLDEFDHEHLSDFYTSVREEVEVAVERIYSDSVKNRVEQLLSKASVSINL